MYLDLSNGGMTPYIRVLMRVLDLDSLGEFRGKQELYTRQSPQKLIDTWNRCLREKWAPPAVALAAFNLDFLCVHPFRDGNGRVSRLALLLQAYQAGMEVGRYISLERLIEQNKDRYYETLEQCSIRWHEGKHDPWPFINYILNILKYS
jgi:Fic family protein